MRSQEVDTCVVDTLKIYQIKDYLPYGGGIVSSISHNNLTYKDDYICQRQIFYHNL